MSIIYGLEYKQAQKRAKELKSFLLKLDSICDTLYDNLEFSGVYESLLKLEDVRVRYYVEFYEHDKIVRLKGKKQNG
jgi:hypothetical protein